MHGRAKQFGEGIMVSGSTNRAVGHLLEEEEEEEEEDDKIAVLPNSITDSDGPF